MKIAEIQQMENDLISGKLGSDSIKYTEFIFKTEQLLGIPPTDKQYLENYHNKLKFDLDSVLTLILKGALANNAIIECGLNVAEFYGRLNTQQMQMIQSLKSNYIINNK